MARIMYDSTDPNDIPVNAQMVAGYIDGTSSLWPESSWNRFPNSVKVRIARRTSTNDGHVLDVEKGIPTVWPPNQGIVNWVQMRRSAGMIPTIYVNEVNDWGPVRKLFTDAKVPQPLWWVARYNNKQEIPAGAIARQFANPDVHKQGHFDLSIVADFWPGVDEGDEEMALSQELVTFKRATDGLEITVSLADMITNLYAAEFYGSQHSPWNGESNRELLLRAAGEDTTELAQLVSANLIGAGVGGATPEQVETAILSGLQKLKITTEETK